MSAAILEQIDHYRAVLEDFSRRLLPLIQSEPTADGKVKVFNDTAEYYRFFDATPHPEFLYPCVKKTIEEDPRRETDFLHRCDRFRARIEEIIDMPARTNDLLFQFLRQNDGRMSKKARENEFEKMTDAEVTTAEKAYADAFANDR